MKTQTDSLDARIEDTRKTLVTRIDDAAVNRDSIERLTDEFVHQQAQIREMQSKRDRLRNTNKPYHKNDYNRAREEEQETEDPEGDVRLSTEDDELPQSILLENNQSCKGMVIQWPWSINHLLQVFGRLIRLGQTRFVKWMIYTVLNTIYDRLEGIIWKKYVRQLTVESSIPKLVTGPLADVAADAFGIDAPLCKYEKEKVHRLALFFENLGDFLITEVENDQESYAYKGSFKMPTYLRKKLKEAVTAGPSRKRKKDVNDVSRDSSPESSRNNSPIPDTLENPSTPLQLSDWLKVKDADNAGKIERSYRLPNPLLRGAQNIFMENHFSPLSGVNNEARWDGAAVVVNSENKNVFTSDAHGKGGKGGNGGDGGDGGDGNGGDGEDGNGGGGGDDGGDDGNGNEDDGSGGPAVDPLEDGSEQALRQSRKDRLRLEIPTEPATSQPGDPAVTASTAGVDMPDVVMPDDGLAMSDVVMPDVDVDDGGDGNGTMHRLARGKCAAWPPSPHRSTIVTVNTLSPTSCPPCPPFLPGQTLAEGHGYWDCAGPLMGALVGGVVVTLLNHKWSAPPRLASTSAVVALTPYDV
ncbi:hypothetical protein DL768_003159 [Monosporascus sp. mg162]|nr:hypothetical protein DL768_003159 [Monosporascus sp. mg162]